MGKPFNFFGYTSPPFFLQGAFLFDDDFNFDVNWSGDYTGVLSDFNTLRLTTTGIYSSDIEPEAANLALNYSGHFSGINLELTNLNFGITGSVEDSVEVDRVNYDIKWSGELVEEKVYKFSLSNSLSIDNQYTGVSGEFYSILNNVDEVKMHDTTGDITSLSLSIPSGSFQRIATVEDTETLSFAINGLYQKDIDT